MSRKILVIALLALLALSVMPVSAGMTVVMANPGGIAERDYVVTWGNGTFFGYYNASSIINLTGLNETYVFTLKPLSSNPLEDPTDWLTNTAVPLVESNAIGLILLAYVVGIITRGLL